MTKKSYETDILNSEVNIPSFDTPMDYKALLSELTDINNRYPFVKITYMGTSVLGRGIPMITLGDGLWRHKSVLYVGCHHGMEWITSSLLLRFVYDYCEAYIRRGRVHNVSVENLFRARAIHIIPCLNVDGADIQINGVDGCILRDRLLMMNGSEDFSTWQANARGVDLNHNYNAKFYEYKQLERMMGIDGGCATRFSGESPESEPEIASICSFLRYSTDIGMLMSLHTQGEVIYCGSDVYVPRAASLASLLGRMTGYSVKRPEGPAAYGGLTDWYTSTFRRPAFTLECGKGVNPLPLSDLYNIYKRLREAFFSVPLLV